MAEISISENVARKFLQTAFGSLLEQALCAANEMPQNREELAQTIHDISETCEVIKMLGSQIHTDARVESESAHADTVEEIPCDGEPRFIGLSRQGQLIFFCFKKEHDTIKGELFYAFPNRGEDILGRKCSEVLGKLPENGIKNEIRQHIRKLCEYDGLEILATERIDENEFIDKILNNIDFFIILYDLANLELARRNIRLFLSEKNYGNRANS